MALKNLLRRKTRTFLTILGISLGVASIILLGAVAEGLQAGYKSMSTGTRADLVLSQPNAMDVSYSSVSESVGPELEAMPEVSETTGMLEGFVQAEGAPYFFVFGYPDGSFLLDKFQITQGTNLANRDPKGLRGKPLILGAAAAKALKKETGDTLRLGDSSFRVIGIYQTGDAFEDSGAVMNLKQAQDTLGKARQVSLYYIRLKDLSLRPRLEARINRQWPDLELSGTSEFGDKQILDDMMKGYTWVIAGLAILLGGVGMMNAQLMSVFERTREIGVLRAVGWSSRRVLTMILGESIIVCVAGGLMGIGLGWLGLDAITNSTVMMGMTTSSITPDLIYQSLATALLLGLAGGIYPAWRAARLQPVEALRYEGGSSGQGVHRLPFGGMAVQSLRQRSTRSLLTLSVIAITVGAIMALDSIVQGTGQSLTRLVVGTDAQVMVRQANISDTSVSAIDERFSEKIAAMPEVAATSGMMFTAVMLPNNTGFFIIQGYGPNDFSMSHFKIVRGVTLTNNHQIIIGSIIAESLKKDVGDTLVLSGNRFRIVGVYESGIGWEEMGGVITLRDAQAFMGRPRKVTMIAVKLNDPAQAAALVQKINQDMPEVYATLTGDFANQLPDMKASNALIAATSLLAVIVGGLGVMNTMLMAVQERTREIGVLRALGWRQRAVMGLILRESVLLAALGGIAGVLLAFSLAYSLKLVPMLSSSIEPLWNVAIFARALGVALILGLVGGGYPAFRATRLQPVEALRYE